MSILYNVYTHPVRGQWGFSTVTSENAVHTASVDPDGNVTRGKLDPLKVAPVLQKHLRGGYQKSAQGKYLHLTVRDGREHGEFVTQHPDLGRALEGERVFFVAVPEGIAATEVTAVWTDRLESCSGKGRTRDAWLKHCQQVTAYLPAMSQDAHAALLVAEWGRENDLMLVCEGAEVPPSPPSRQRHEWRAFLRRWFTESKVDDALAELGWPLNEALAAASTAPGKTTTPAGDEWTSLAQQASF